jgi:integrase
MASISHDKKSGRRTIQFKDNDGSRKSIRLGKCDQKSAQAIRTQIEHLVAAKGHGTAMPPQTTEWLKTIDETLYKRISAVGLVDARKSALLGPYIAEYMKRRIDVANGTQLKWRATQTELLSFLGEGRDLRTITGGDADAFRLMLMDSDTIRGGKMMPNTVSKHIKVARQFFNAAIRDEVISRNPFSGVDSGERKNADREYFITREEAEKCIDAAPDSQWRLIIALARYGGLRTPSEMVGLRWDDILWDKVRMIVTSPKTKRHEGGESRVVPIFPELRRHLDEAYEIAADRTEFVITRYRGTDANMRTTFQKIIRRAGLTPWPKLMQNLRASRQTELEETFPTHVVCKWMGNSPKVAQKHYLQTTEDHFSKAVQNPVQQASATCSVGSQATEPKREKPLENRVSQGLACGSINPTRT